MPWLAGQLVNEHQNVTSVYLCSIEELPEAAEKAIRSPKTRNVSQDYSTAVGASQGKYSLRAVVSGQ